MSEYGTSIDPTMRYRITTWLTGRRDSPYPNSQVHVDAIVNQNPITKEIESIVTIEYGHGMYPERKTTFVPMRDILEAFRKVQK